MDKVKFLGQDCVALENKNLRLLIGQSIGPRVLWLSPRDGKNLLAEIPDFVTAQYHFYGGHRLWHAPEDLNRTYEPDDAPVQISAADGGLLVTQEVEARTGLQKSMEVRLHGDQARVTVIHRLMNHGVWPVTCALWAITQLKTGGVAVLPQTTEDAGLLPNRSLALWPYTNPADPHLIWGRSHILIEARLDAPFKIGFSNPRGWLGYWWDGVFFVKHTKYEAQAAYYDLGCSHEFYCSSDFAELETLSPIHSIGPGGTVSHSETWDLYEAVERPRNDDEARALAERLGLG